MEYLDKAVYITECDDYNIDKIRVKLNQAFTALGLNSQYFKDKNVLIKANLVMAKKPEYAATTHPAFVRAIADIVYQYEAASLTVADSPGGPFNHVTLSSVYNTCGLNDIAGDRIKLNADFTYSPVRTNGFRLKNFNIINAFLKADIVIDLCKLKTHALTGMTCSIKNLFGIIPGVEKVEMHSNFTTKEDFSEMLVDLAEYAVSTKPIIAICDAVLSHEGNGPTHGIPKKTGLILMSKSLFSLDVVAEHIMKMDGEVLFLNYAAERGLTKRNYEDIDIIGMDSVPTFDFVRSDASKSMIIKYPKLLGGRIAKLLETRPKINRKKCIGCGKCASSCPKHTIVIKKNKQKRIAKINPKNCIKCYCCQELCPIGAVDVKQSLIVKILR